MKFTEVLRNPHFNNLAAIIRVPFQSDHWRRDHAGVPFWLLVNAFSDAVSTETPLDKKRVANEFMALVIALTQADERLVYTEDDLDWFVSVVDMSDGEAKAILNLFKAWFAAPDATLTPSEIAQQTGTVSSGWRNKAAAGEFPGAQKRGDTWLIPVSVLRSRGYDVKAPTSE